MYAAPVVKGVNYVTSTIDTDNLSGVNNWMQSGLSEVYSLLNAPLRR